MTGRLEGRTALVTGGARGIGRAIALELAAQGAHVLASSVAGDNGIEDAARPLPGRLAYHRADVSDEAQVLDLFAAARATLGRLDILVNNAGILGHKPLLDTGAEEFDRIVAVNLRGMFLCGREAVRLMTESEQSGGRIINMASDLSYLGRAEFSAYCATKAGARALTRCWALEFAPDILVNALCPGPIDTDMLSTDTISPEWREKEMDIPLARFGTPEEVAAMAVFLAGPGAGFVTGQGFGINGGSVMP